LEMGYPEQKAAIGTEKSMDFIMPLPRLRIPWQRRPNMLPVLLTALCLIALPGNLAAQEATYFDSRVLLLHHPLLQQFSPLHRRFSGTSSEPVPDGEKGIAALQSSLADTERKLAAATAEFQKAMSKGVNAGQRRDLEARHLKQTADLQKSIATLQDRIRNARRVPGRPGLTLGISTGPQIETIANDLRRVVLALSAQHRNVILDVSGLFPKFEHTPDSRYLKGNKHFQLWQSQGSPSADDLLFLRHARWALANQTRAFRPVVFGGIDARLESVKLLQDTVGK
jgi:uncharacterized protein YoaH (UPF0181 family)